MKKATRLRILLGALVIPAALTLSTAPAMAAGHKTPKPAAYTCTGGEIPSGNYASVTVTGECSVAAGAVIDAQSVPSTITVGRNVTGAAGSLVGLGVDGPEPTSDITIGGNISVTNAHTVLLRWLTVEGNVTLTGGGADIPWAIKNNTIGGNLTVSGQTADWLGVLFNTIERNATLTNITVTANFPGSSQAVFVVRNTIGRNLTCMGLGPNVSGGFVPGSVNVVGRNANGQCAALI